MEPSRTNDLSVEQNLLLEKIEKTLRTKYWKWTFLSSVTLPSSLFSHLSSALPHIGTQEWGERAEFGGIYLNGQPALEDRILPCPCLIEYYEPKFAFHEASAIYPEITPDNIVYHDQDLAVVYKPTRLPSMPAKEQRLYSLKAGVEKILGVKVHMPSRLDVSVQGLVAVSTSERMNRPLQHLFEHRRITKEYVLATSALPPSAMWEIDAAIGRDPLHPVLRRVDAAAGKPSLTSFKLRSSATKSLPLTLYAKPLTGRTHQIRVHAAHSGIPILGDNFYGGDDADELHLVSYRISFIHPLSQHPVEIELPDKYRPNWL